MKRVPGSEFEIFGLSSLQGGILLEEPSRPFRDGHLLEAPGHHRPVYMSVQPQS